MFGIFKKYESEMEYLPILLLSFIFIAENDLGKHTVNMFYRVIIALITVCIFYISTRLLKYTKYAALFVSILTWVILIYAKKKIMS